LLGLAAHALPLLSLLAGSVNGLQQRSGSAQGCEAESLVCDIICAQIAVASPIWPVMGQAHARVGSVVAKSAMSVSTVQKELCHFFIVNTLRLRRAGVPFAPASLMSFVSEDFCTALDTAA
jgi:hypothetical protein